MEGSNRDILASLFNQALTRPVEWELCFFIRYANQGCVDHKRRYILWGTLIPTHTRVGTRGTPRVYTLPSTPLVRYASIPRGQAC